MVRIVTFLGNATYVDKAIEKNRLTDVYVDIDYVYEVDDKGRIRQIDKSRIFLNVIKSEKPELLRNVSVHYVSSGIPMGSRKINLLYVGDDVEVVNRRVRIAKMLTLIASDIQDDILFLDSDITVDDVHHFVDLARQMDTVVALCIPAFLKPTNVVDIFCKSTNFYLPSRFRDRLVDVLSGYMSASLYVGYPVDIYIHNALGSATVRWNGVCHHKPSRVYCVRDGMITS